LYGLKENCDQPSQALRDFRFNPSRPAGFPGFWEGPGASFFPAIEGFRFCV
jgi:hypothetical protein